MSSDIDWNNIETACKKMQELLKIIQMDNKEYDSFMEDVRHKINEKLCPRLNLDEFEVSITYANGKIYVKTTVDDINSNLIKNIESLGFEWRILDVYTYSHLPPIYHLELTKQVLEEV